MDTIMELLYAVLFVYSLPIRFMLWSSETITTILNAAATLFWAALGIYVSSIAFVLGTVAQCCGAGFLIDILLQNTTPDNTQPAPNTPRRPSSDDAKARPTNTNGPDATTKKAPSPAPRATCPVKTTTGLFTFLSEEDSLAAMCTGAGMGSALFNARFARNAALAAKRKGPSDAAKQRAAQAAAARAKEVGDAIAVLSADIKAQGDYVAFADKAATLEEGRKERARLDAEREARLKAADSDPAAAFAAFQASCAAAQADDERIAAGDDCGGGEDDLMCLVVVEEGEGEEDPEWL